MRTASRRSAVFANFNNFVTSCMFANTTMPFQKGVYSSEIICSVVFFKGRPILLKRAASIKITELVPLLV